MSITLITGVPGSGKTLKAVWDHLRPFVGNIDKKTDDQGNTVEIPSVVYTNINSLLLDHELIEGGGTWYKGKEGPRVVPSGDAVKEVSTGADGWIYEGNPLGLRNWHNWAKPGAKIFFDEFQKFWPPRPNGSPVPPDIQALDTHRHMGLDFVLITQNCMNVDRHILGLVDRHLHVRRVANMPLAVVYEWDHASKTLNYKNSMSKSPWRYPMKAYKLYKSAELHTKQKRKLPGLVWFILAGLAGAAYAAPTLKSRFEERISGNQLKQIKTEKKGVQTYEKDGIKYTVETSTAPALPASSPLPDAPASAAAAAPAAPSPVVAGCIVVRERCGCMDASGQPVQVEPGVCEDRAGVGRSKPVEFADSPRPPAEVSESERDALQFAYLRKKNLSPSRY
jgi:zona occludens toxin